MPGAFIHFSPNDKNLFGEFSFKTHRIDPPFMTSVESAWVDSVFKSLSDEERIAQLFMVAVYPDRDENHYKEVEWLIKKYHIGGLIFFQGNPVQQASLNNRFQHIAKTPLLVAIDGEWGLNMRIDSTVKYPKQMMLGAIQDERLILEMGMQIGEQLNRMGVQVNFAPVADVNNNPNNPVINMRSFGEDRANVARKSILYMAGLQDENVLSVAKHFPGHGDTDIDSHKSLPLISYERSHLDSVELFPFKQLITSGVGGVMVAHLSVPSLDPTPNLASTLSPVIVDSLLKKDMGFKGLVFTDAMNMGGIAGYYKPYEANIKAVKAGNDVILMPGDIGKTISGIQREIRKGHISGEDIDNRCKKILSVKYWAGLNSKRFVDTRNLTDDLNKPEYQLLNQKLVEASLTMLKNNNALLPLKRLDTLKIATITIGGDKSNTFCETLGKYAKTTNYYLPDNAKEIIINKVINDISDYNLLIVSVQGTDMRAAKNYGIPDYTTTFIDSIIKLKPVIVDLFANPYTLAWFKNIRSASGLIISYEDNEVVQRMSAQLIFGVFPAKGLLPVTACQDFPIRSGIESEALNRLKYSLPIEAGINEKCLGKIDSIVISAIEARAVPGCQVIVARNGIVFYQKSFGYHTYRRKNKVLNNDLYDLASVTKITATVPAIMHLSEEKLLNIDEKISTYLPDLDTTNKKDILIKDILLHQSGLKAWIPFYINTLEPVYPDQSFASSRFSESYPIKIGHNYYVNKHLKYIDSCYSITRSDDYPVKVADCMYMKKSYIDTIWTAIANSELNGNGVYKYSDLGFYWFYKVIENLTCQHFEDYLDSTFYNTMGAWSVCFNPLNRFKRNEIAPTENDLVFRRQLVHGYVHDMGAAMMGGVCGHAGLFSNANDLAKILQMYLNGGVYGEIRYLKKETVKYFTDAQEGTNGNRRSIGFDKPEPDTTKTSPASRYAPESSYGHTGFTGTMVWADPENDLLYVFLSNRVYPDMSNNKLVELDIRTKIQDVIYEAIIKD